jgi:hypothetical protein
LVGCRGQIRTREESHWCRDHPTTCRVPSRVYGTIETDCASRLRFDSYRSGRIEWNCCGWTLCGTRLAAAKSRFDCASSQLRIDGTNIPNTNQAHEIVDNCIDIELALVFAGILLFTRACPPFSLIVSASFADHSISAVQSRSIDRLSKSSGSVRERVVCMLIRMRSNLCGGRVVACGGVRRR